MEAVVVGAGAAGLGAAASMRARGIDVVVLERGTAPGERWRHRYDGVRLNTVSWLSGLPGKRIPRERGAWPSGAAFGGYLEDYARDRGLDVRTGVEVERIERAGASTAGRGARWRVETSDGPVEARHVVVALGYDHTPFLPDWPGREEFAGELIHAAEYRNAARFRGRRVLVVGVGNSGVELAAELVRGGAADVQVAVRTPPNLVTRSVNGVPTTLVALLGERAPAAVGDAVGFRMQRRLWGDLEPYGLARAPLGIATELRRKGLGPVVDSGFVELLKAGRIEIVPAVEQLAGHEAVLRGGRSIRPDAVIAATGYRHGLEPIVGQLGVLDGDGRPLVNGGEQHPAAPGLFFNGYRFPLRGQLPYMSTTSRQIGRAVARDRRRRGSPAPVRGRCRPRATLAAMKGRAA
jgi:cation diffusion facilitator CzcD-associated flavoprotein CzcO